MKSTTSIALAIALGLLAGCGAAGLDATTNGTPSPTPFGPFTDQQANSCTAVVLALDWTGDSGQNAEQVTMGLGDVEPARKSSLAVAMRYAALLKPLSGNQVGEPNELKALRDALSAAISAFAKPMTEAQFTAVYERIHKAQLAFSDTCSGITHWVNQNLLH